MNYLYPINLINQPVRTTMSFQFLKQPEPRAWALKVNGKIQYTALTHTEASNQAWRLRQADNNVHIVDTITGQRIDRL